jgi:predicted nucleic acid-binding protein
MMDDDFGPLVVDTDVVSFLFDQDAVRASRYERILRGRKCYLPFVVMGELLYRVEHRHWGPSRRARLAEFLKAYWVVQTAPDIVEVWAAPRADAMRCGRAIERQDAWVAAVALTLGLPLVTHNATDFAGVSELEVITSPDV